MVTAGTATLLIGFVFITIAVREEADRINQLFCRYAGVCLLYTSPSPRDRQKSRMPSSA